MLRRPVVSKGRAVEGEELREGGFSILELMIALGILAVGILAIVSMQITTIQENDTAVELTEANLSAQSIIESFMRVGYTAITNTISSPGPNYTADGYTIVNLTTMSSMKSVESSTAVANQFATNLINAIPSGFTVEFRVTSQTDTNGDGTDDLKRINVRVRDQNLVVRSNFNFVKGR